MSVYGWIDFTDAASSRCAKCFLLSLRQEDSSDLKCQLHFAKEESALMCKKLTKLVKDSDAMKEELAKYRSLYGDVNASLTVEEVGPGGGWEPSGTTTWSDLPVTNQI